MIQRLRKDIENKEEGFTLVELLVVIVILGILAAIVVFAVGGITDKGTNAANQTDTSILQAAEEASFAQGNPTGAYLSETALVNGKFLRSLSTKNDICLKGTTDYAVVAAPASAAACTAALAGSVPAP